MSCSEFKITKEKKIILKKTGEELTFEDLLNARKVDIHNFITEKGKKSIGFISDKIGKHKPALKNCLDIDCIFDALIGATTSLSHNKEKHYNIKKKIKEIYIPIVLTYNSYASSIVESKQITEFGLHEMGGNVYQQHLKSYSDDDIYMDFDHKNQRMTIINIDENKEHYIYNNVFVPNILVFHSLMTAIGY
jgi:hypothetical protein